MEGECVLEGRLPLGGHVYSSPPLGTHVHSQGLDSLHVHVASRLELPGPSEEALDFAEVELDWEEEGEGGVGGGRGGNSEWVGRGGTGRRGW